MILKGARKFQKISWLSGLTLLAVLMAVGNIACQKKAEEAKAPEGANSVTAQKNEYEGIVKVGLGKYFYLPSASGFDIVIQGQIESGDASVLVGKEVRVKGSLLKDKPSIFVADTIDLKVAGQYRNVYTRTGGVVLDDYFDTAARDAYQALKITSANKPEEWEGKGNGKVFGKLETVAGEGAQKPSYRIILTDDKNKEIGKILVDNQTTYATYYIKKLRLFDKFWFYISVKDSVDKKVRAKTQELFHADMVFAGLY